MAFIAFIRWIHKKKGNKILRDPMNVLCQCQMENTKYCGKRAFSIKTSKRRENVGIHFPRDQTLKWT